MLGRVRFFLGCTAALLFVPLVRGDEEPVELQQARTQFQKEVDFALRPMRDRYVTRLQTLKRTLASKGDVRAAVAVQDEIDLIVATANEPTNLARYVGTWVGDFKVNIRRFSVKADTAVEWLHENGTVFTVGRLVRIGKDFVFTWDTVDQIDRVTLAEGGMVMETFAPKITFPKGPPTSRVVLTRTAQSK